MSACSEKAPAPEPMLPPTITEADASVGEDASQSGGFEAGLGGPSDCVKRTCVEASANCGPIADGCGGLTESCGTCPAGQVCGGGGTPSVCGTNIGPCTPQTCERAGANCGPIADGCGGTLDCGTCTGDQTCGGGGTASVCGVKYVAADGGVLGDGGSCVKKTCGSYGANCGPVADGCGGLTASCGSCTAPFICGGGGKANVCGNPYADDSGVVCTPKKCTDVGATCGWIGDGCGGTAFCGNCTAPDICGGGGVPSKCGGGGGTPCTDPLCSKIPVCAAGSETTISGTVYAPNGAEPLYNAIVYIPKGTVAPYSDSITCDRCDAPREALASAITGPDGKFTLTGAIPAGTNIPLVIELGRWRRYVTISNVSACVPNPLAATLTRLPKRQAEGNALDNIPRMAIATGNVDALECVLRKMGIEDGVFGNPTFTDATKRIHFYEDNGAQIDRTTPSWTTLANDLATMRKYDAIIYACRGNEGTARTTANKDALRTYANEGGRVFATHYSYMWLIDNDNWATSATWRRDGGSATGSDTTPLVSDVNTGFPKGLAFSQWLANVGALSSAAPPKVDILVSRKDVVEALSPATPWITSASPQTAQHMTFNTPFKGSSSSLCGRVLFSDFHVTDANSTGGKSFPAECNTTPLSAQEKVLEFMLFDLASCVSDVPPPPPPTCTKRTCADAGAKCGQVADGCGGLTPSCGTCPVGETCGGGGVAGECGGPKCTPKTCAQLGFSCGMAGNGCGGTMNCGDCTVAGETCGGGGVAGKCGKPTSGGCVPKTCASLGFKCGPAGDGCGKLIDCGSCTPPETCGGGGVAGECGAPKCTPTTCANLGYECGVAVDGCGGTLNCGTCTPPATCGGDGTPGRCSTAPR